MVIKEKRGEGGRKPGHSHFLLSPVSSHIGHYGEVTKGGGHIFLNLIFLYFIPDSFNHQESCHIRGSLRQRRPVSSLMITTLRTPWRGGQCCLLQSLPREISVLLVSLMSPLIFLAVFISSPYIFLRIP